jgi:alanine dehydrogenase
MTLLLSNEQLDQLLDMPACMSALERAYVDLAQGRGLSRTRSDCLVPAERPHAHYGLMTQDGVIPSLGIGAIRINSDIIEMKRVDGKLRREKIPVAPGDRYVGLVTLFSVATGEPLAIFPDGVMQRLRVGATSGLGMKHLSRPDARSVGLIGAGGQAGAQLKAACAVRDIRTIHCFSPNAGRRAAFCRTMSELLGIDVIAVDSPEAALRDADVALCATSSEEPIFFAPWLRPGLHVGSIRKPEVDQAALLACDRVAIHTRDVTPLMEISVDLRSDKDVSERRAKKPGELDIARFPTLAEIIAGRAEGRRNDAEITCFMNNLGTGYQFAALGAVAYAKAREQRFGHHLPTDWFTEDICP